MSRRSRRSKSKSSSQAGRRSSKGALSKWILRVILVMIVALGVASIGGYVWLRNYLAGESFRTMLVTESEKLLKAEVQLSPLRWDGFQVNSDSISAEGAYQVKDLQIEGLRTGIEAGRVTDGVWSVVPTIIGKLSLVWDTTAKPPVEETQVPAAPSKPAWYDSLIPKKVETGSIVVGNSDIQVLLADGMARMHETRWEVEPMKNLQQANLQASGGVIQLPYKWLPEIRLREATAIHQNGRIFLTSTDLSLYERGHVVMSGEWDGEQKRLSLEGELEDVLCAEVLPPDWKQKLSGVIASNFKMLKAEESISVEGHLQIRDGILTALPVLDKLAAYSQSMRFRTLTLHDASCDYSWKDGVISLTQIKLGSEGLARLEGSCTFQPLAGGDYSVDGDFQLGLAPGTLSSIPGAEEDVFVPGPRGLLWAPMRITGTLENPNEDLSGRLMAAAGARMFDIIPATGAKVLKYTQQVFDDNGKPVVENVIDKGTGLVDQGVEKIQDAGTKTVETITDGVGGIVDGALNGIFGVKPEEPTLPKTVPRIQQNPQKQP